MVKVKKIIVTRSMLSEFQTYCNETNHKICLNEFLQLKHHIDSDQFTVVADLSQISLTGNQKLDLSNLDLTGSIIDELKLNEHNSIVNGTNFSNCSYKKTVFGPYSTCDSTIFGDIHLSYECFVDINLCQAEYRPISNMSNEDIKIVVTDLMLSQYLKLRKGNLLVASGSLNNFIKNYYADYLAELYPGYSNFVADLSYKDLSHFNLNGVNFQGCYLENATLPDYVKNIDLRYSFCHNTYVGTLYQADVRGVDVAGFIGKRRYIELRSCKLSVSSYVIARNDNYFLENYSERQELELRPQALNAGLLNDKTRIFGPTIFDPCNSPNTKARPDGLAPNYIKFKRADVEAYSQAYPLRFNGTRFEQMLSFKQFLANKYQITVDFIPSLAGVNLNNLDLSDLDFGVVDFSFASFINSKINNISFSDNNMASNFSAADMSGARSMFYGLVGQSYHTEAINCSFNFCQMIGLKADYARFNNSEMNRVVAIGMSARYAIFDNCQAHGSNLSESDISNASLINVVACFANWQAIEGESIKLIGTQQKPVDFSYLRINDSVLSYSQISFINAPYSDWSNVFAKSLILNSNVLINCNLEITLQNHSYVTFNRFANSDLSGAMISSEQSLAAVTPAAINSNNPSAITRGAIIIFSMPKQVAAYLTNKLTGSPIVKNNDFSKSLLNKASIELKLADFKNQLRYFKYNNHVGWHNKIKNFWFPFELLKCGWVRESIHVAYDIKLLVKGQYKAGWPLLKEAKSQLPFIFITTLIGALALTSIVAFIVSNLVSLMLIPIASCLYPISAIIGGIYGLNVGLTKINFYKHAYDSYINLGNNIKEAEALEQRDLTELKAHIDETKTELVNLNNQLLTQNKIDDPVQELSDIASDKSWTIRSVPNLNEVATSSVVANL